MSGNGWTHIDSVHKKIHDGAMWVATVDAAALASAATLAMLINPKDNTELHLDIVGSASGKSMVELYESPTVSANGTDVTVNNAKRTKSGDAPFLAYKDPTVTENGDELDGIQLAGGVATGLGGSGGPRYEWILDPAKTYLILFTSQAVGVDAHLAVHAYED